MAAQQPKSRLKSAEGKEELASEPSASMYGTRRTQEQTPKATNQNNAFQFLNKQNPAVRSTRTAQISAKPSTQGRREQK
jgi:hypothetical protein